MSRTRIVVLAALLTLSMPAVAATGPASASVPLSRIEGRGFWGDFICAACVGTLLGVSVLEPGVPYLFDEYGDVWGACKSACKAYTL